MQRIVEEKQFSVVGIAVRTSNAMEAAGRGAISQLWDRFFREGILQKIPSRLDEFIYAVYSGYASDRNGDYDLLIGARVPEASAVPPGMTVRSVPAGKYAVHTSPRGPVQKVVAEAWQAIWRLEDSSQLGGRRSYIADFELYDPRNFDPQNCQIDLYIGIH